MNDFISDLEKAFVVNKIVANRQHIVIISCLKKTAASYNNKLNGIIS